MFVEPEQKLVIDADGKETGQFYLGETCLRGARTSGRRLGYPVDTASAGGVYI